MKVFMFMITFVAITIFHDATSFSIASPRTLCHDGERQALLEFKHDLKDPSKRLGSWDDDGGDCCNWAGVVCHNLTGHVHELHLRNPFDYQSKYHDRTCLTGSNISDSLLGLKHLHYLDLSNNCFGYIQVPEFIGSMQSLRYLNLSFAGFGGLIPHQLGNLSNLHVLSIAITGSHAENLGWLSGLSFLQHLDLSYMDLSKASDWLQGINALLSLEELCLSDCRLYNNPILPCINVSSLTVLDLSLNGFEGPIPSCLANLSSLKSLDLSDNDFNSLLPNWLYHFNQLEKLNLGGNMFQGIKSKIGDTNLGFLRTMCNLKWIDLSDVPINLAVSKVLKSFSLCASSKLEHLSMPGCRLFGPLLFELRHFNNLEHLDLSENSISGPIPKSFGFLTSLKEVDISSNQLNGTLPHGLGNLIGLEYLHLENNSISSIIPKSIGFLTSLKEVDLSSNHLTGCLPFNIGKLILLEKLYLDDNYIFGLIPESIGSLTSLTRLSMSSNHINGSLPTSIGQLSRLQYLNLSHNSISGLIPESFGFLTSLTEVHLSSNQLNGSLPQSLRQLIKLEYLDLQDNLITSLFPDTLGSLASLRELYLSRNSINCTLSEASFTNLTSLIVLEASNNPITLKVSPYWIPPFQLAILSISSWHLGPKFPQWLRSQNVALFQLDISNTGIMDRLPVWFMNLSSHFSNDFLLEGGMDGFNVIELDLSSNHLTGPLPQLAFNIIRLDLSNNSFSGPISRLLCDTVFNEMMLVYLHLGSNQLSGEIPDCWNSWKALVSVRLQNNNLTGKIPNSIGHLSELQSLHLRSNNLSGTLPSSFQYLTKLITLDLGGNHFGGSIPRWIGTSLSKLRILSLGSNNFKGLITRELCALRFLIILDLGNNKLSGSIPKCFGDLMSMANLSSNEFENSYNATFSNGTFQVYSSSTYIEDLTLVIGELVLEYTNNLYLMVAIDISSNNLSGEIPETITNLVKLISLNLSRNSLTGKIPENIGSITSLESLDLSSNQLTGNIPQSMTRMTFVRFLNLSYNHLTGRIPTSTQLQGLNSSSFIGNHLCGRPISDNCSTNAPTPNGERSHNHGHGIDELYVSLVVGFVVGFWAIIGPLIYSKRWRFTFFHSLQNLWDTIWMYAMIIGARLKGRA